MQGGSTDSGILFWTRNNSPGGPATTSESVAILNNEFVDLVTGIYVAGGTEKTTIKDNSFIQSGALGQVAQLSIILTDVFQFSHGGIVTHPSSNISIKQNHMAGNAVTGVLINGDTSGIKLKNNSYNSPHAMFGDVVLADEDVLFGWGDILCPAHTNKVIADEDFPAVVLNGYSSRCEGSSPNKVKGEGAFEINLCIRGLRATALGSKKGVGPTLE
jgi:hypothetical protein